MPVRPRAKFDGVVRRNALHHSPIHSCSGNHIPAPQYFFQRPRFTPIQVMQRSYNSRRPGLRGIMQRHRVFRPKPTPRLLHGSSELAAPESEESIAVGSTMFDRYFNWPRIPGLSRYRGPPRNTFAGSYPSGARTSALLIAAEVTYISSRSGPPKQSDEL